MCGVNHRKLKNITQKLLQAKRKYPVKGIRHASKKSWTAKDTKNRSYAKRVANKVGVSNKMFLKVFTHKYEKYKKIQWTQQSQQCDL